MVRILSLTTPAETFEVRRSRYRKGPCRSSVEVELVAIVASESRDTVLLESPLSFRCCRYGASASRTIQDGDSPRLGFLEKRIFKVG